MLQMLSSTQEFSCELKFNCFSYGLLKFQYVSSCELDSWKLKWKEEEKWLFSTHFIASRAAKLVSGRIDYSLPRVILSEIFITIGHLTSSIHS